MSKFFRRFGLIAIVAVLLTYFLQYRYFDCDFSVTWDFILTRPSVFWYNTLILFFIVLFLSSLFRRPWFGIGLSWSAISILTFINSSKMALRHTPLLPEDFQLADQVGSLADFVDFWAIIRLILACLLMLVACILLDYSTHDFFLPPQHKVKHSAYWLRHQLLPRFTLIAIAVIGFLTSTDFIRHHSGEKNEDIPWLNTSFTAWNQEINYKKNGFIIGFLYNFSKYQLTAPDDYSDTAIASLNSKYSALQSSADSSLPSLSNQDYNIVIVLNESFYDPELIKPYYPYDGDATPFYHKLIQKYPSGQMYSPDYGGGTANVEFEVLTSLTNYWANTVPYTDILTKLPRTPSVASYAKENGYQTTAIHPYNGGMYKRDYALKSEGFDTFITENEMDYNEIDPGAYYVNDRSSYQQVLKTLNDNSQKQFVTLITMQNHASFFNEYHDVEFPVSGLESNPANKILLEDYLKTLYHSDAYLEEFITALDQSKEKTVVLFFGDHSPGIFDGLLKIEDPSVTNLVHLTPYFVYSNFDLPGATKHTPIKTAEPELLYDAYTDEYYYGYTDEDVSASQKIQYSLPTTTPNCLVNTLYGQLKIKKPSYFSLISDVCAKYPILAHAYFNGVPPEPSATLHDYELLNYDILSGNQYYFKKQ